MANFFDQDYDPRLDAASSGVEVTDLRPEQVRDVDLRRLEPEERDAFSDRFKEFGYEKNQADAQKSVASYMRAAKAAGAYRTRAGIAEPTIRGRTPRNPAVVDVQAFGVPFGGTVLPSMGDAVGTAGSTNYANKPQPRFGKAFMY
jgi:hypothetical protein